MADDRIGIEFISTLGLDPVAVAALAGELGCGHVGMAAVPMSGSAAAPWSLRDDRALRADFKRALADNGVTLSIGEGFLGWPGKPATDLEGDLDLIAELGAPVVNITSLDPDLDRAAASLAQFAELAQARGMVATAEFLPGLPMKDLPTALDVLRRAGHANLKLLIDAMHLFRSGSTAADLAAIDPGLIGYLQLCDAPAVDRPDMAYSDEARFERQVPGEGALPLVALLDAMPDGLVVGLEVPMRSKAEAGIPIRDALAPAVAATRRMLAARR